MLPILTRIGKRSVELVRCCNRLAANIQNDVTDPQTVIGRHAALRNRGHHHALGVYPGDRVGRRELKTQLRYVDVRAFAGMCRLVLGLFLVRQNAKRQRDRLLLAIADQIDRDTGPRRHGSNPPRQLARVANRRSIDCCNNVTALDTGFDRRAAGLRLVVKSTGGLLQAHAVGNVRRYRLDLHADPPAGNDALIAQLAYHVLDGTGRNGERDADRAARWRVDRGIDADHVAVDVEGGATGIALVHRRIDLDEIIVGAGANVPAAGGDNTRGHRAAEPERIADRQNPITDARGRVGE